MCEWIEKIGYYIQEGHGDTTECYQTLEEAQEKCIEAEDCGGVTSQNDICPGKWRVSHGGPTFIYYANWRVNDLSSYELHCGPGEDFFFFEAGIIFGIHKYMFVISFTDITSV